MKPVKFLSPDELFEGTFPLEKIEKALIKDILICDAFSSYKVLSYYYSPTHKRMCLDIEIDGD